MQSWRGRWAVHPCFCGRSGNGCGVGRSLGVGRFPASYASMVQRCPLRPLASADPCPSRAIVRPLFKRPCSSSPANTDINVLCLQPRRTRRTVPRGKPLPLCGAGR